MHHAADVIHNQWILPLVEGEHSSKGMAKNAKENRVKMARVHRHPSTALQVGLRQEEGRRPNSHRQVHKQHASTPLEKERVSRVRVGHALAYNRE